MKATIAELAVLLGGIGIGAIIVATVFRINFFKLFFKNDNE